METIVVTSMPFQDDSMIEMAKGEHARAKLLLHAMLRANYCTK
jgi:hypothetical protein